MSTNNINTAYNSSAINNSSFWEVGGYKANVQRIRDGSNQLNELTKLIKERVDLENKYGKSLQAWNQKWYSYSDRQLTNGCIKNCMNDILTESKVLAKVHLSVKDRFNDEVIETINKFKKENYHRFTIRGFKEPKEIEEEFEKAQQRWKKFYEKMESAKKHYHSCRRTEKSAYIQMINSHADSSVSQDGTDKSREKFEKCKEIAEKARVAYEVELGEISKYNGVYVENMAFVFEKCQQMELKRMKFFVEMLNGMQKILVDLVSPPKLLQIHNNLEKTFSAVGEAQFLHDLKQWSLLHGKDLPPNWPVFEEYTPELHNISTKSNSHDSATGVILTKKTLKSENDFSNRHHSIGNVSSKSKTYKLERNMSISTQDIYKLSNNEDFDEHKTYVSTTIQSNHRRVSSFESFQDHSVTNSETITVSKNGNENVSLHVHSFMTAKTSLDRKRNDPFFDPFHMPTPERNIHNENYQSVDSYDGSFCDVANNENAIKKSNYIEIETSDIDESIKKEFDTLENSEKVINKVETLYSSLSVENAEAVKENVLPCGDVFNDCLVDAANDDNDIQCKPEKVKVLYDYNPMEGDELALIKDELIEVLRPADNLGWCYGRKRDTVGFFPAGYVAKI